MKKKIIVISPNDYKPARCSKDIKNLDNRYIMENKYDRTRKQIDVLQNH